MKDKIFIVEDEIVVANDIKQILKSNGFNVVGLATRYKEAKSKILELNPDIVLCDINLHEEKTGISLMQEMSEKCDFRIIFISAYSDHETIEKANLVTPFNYLTKPFNDRQLITSVRMALLSLQGNSSNIEKPTKRELTIIKLLAKGQTSEDVGNKLFISRNTVDTHRRKMLKKYSMKSTTELVSLAINQHWI